MDFLKRIPRIMEYAMKKDRMQRARIQIEEGGVSYKDMNTHGIPRGTWTSVVFLEVSLVSQYKYQSTHYIAY